MTVEVSLICNNIAQVNMQYGTDTSASKPSDVKKGDVVSCWVASRGICPVFEAKLCSGKARVEYAYPPEVKVEVTPIKP